MSARPRRRGAAHTTVAASAAAALTLLVASPALAQEVSVDPSGGLSDGDQVAVSVSGLDDLEGEQVAIVQCGNADSDGTPIPASEADSEDFQANCFGAEALGTPQLVLAAVSGGAVESQYTVTRSDIGANGAQCIPNADAELPCTIAVADVATEGEALSLSAPIDFGSGEGTDGSDAEGDATDADAEGDEAAGDEAAGDEAAGDEAPDELAATGLGVLPIALAGAGIAGVGSLTVLAARRRRS